MMRIVADNIGAAGDDLTHTRLQSSRTVASHLPSTISATAGHGGMVTATVANSSVPREQNLNMMPIGIVG